jgi:hypothetical protein
MPINIDKAVHRVVDLVSHARGVHEFLANRYR